MVGLWVHGLTPGQTIVSLSPTGFFVVQFKELIIASLSSQEMQEFNASEVREQIISLHYADHYLESDGTDPTVTMMQLRAIE